MQLWTFISIALLPAASLVSDCSQASKLFVAAKLSPTRRKQRRSIEQRGLIIGGGPATPGDYPYFVHYAAPGCGGSVSTVSEVQRKGGNSCPHSRLQLVAPDIVLTAGHCKLDSLSDYGSIYVGRHRPDNDRDGAEGFTVIGESRHPLFDSEVCCGRSGDTWFYGVHYDFMLLKLSGESSTLPIRLNTNPSRPRNNEELHAIGFGDVDPGYAFLEPDRLHEVSLNYMSNGECIANSIYPANLLNSASLCASDYREDACAGDSGGPLIAKGRRDADDILMGVVSWGWDCAAEPGVYARVSHGYPWIREEVCRMSRNPPKSFRCPTPTIAATVARPTRPPTKRPAPNPTFAPSQGPSAALSAFPSTHPTQVPSYRPSVGPTVAPTMIPTTGPTRASSVIPTAGPTINGDLENSLGSDSQTDSQTDSQEFVAPDVIPEDALIEISALDPKPIQRSLLPTGKSCATASASPTVCCSSISNKADGTFGDDCFPAPGKSAFDGGFPCEASSWIQANDPESFNPRTCDAITTSTEESELESGELESVVLTGNRSYLPSGASCSDITRRTDCCNFLDNRNEQGSVYHGQPCVAVRTKTDEDNAVCQPANLAASMAPGRAMNCADVDASTSSSNSTTKSESILGGHLEQLLEELEKDVLMDQLIMRSTLPRTDLPNGQSCQNINDPLVCCAAQLDHATGGAKTACAPSRQPSMSKGMISRTRGRPRSICHPAASIDAIPPSGTDNTTEKTAGSEMSRSWPQQDSINSKQSEDTRDSCRRVSRMNARRRVRISDRECSSIQTVRSCCSAVDSYGQYCLPVRTSDKFGGSTTRTCAPVDWIVSNLSNVTLIECPRHSKLNI